MARRSKDWNEGLAKDVRSPDFARHFLIRAIDDERISVQQALGKVIRLMGVHEFAARIGMAAPNVLRSINPKHNPTMETLNRLLLPFGMRLTLAPIRSRRKAVSQIAVAANRARRLRAA